MTSAFSAARRETSSAVIVSVPSGRWAPCCSHEPIGTSTMSDRSWNHAMSGGARSSRQLEKGRVSSGMGWLLDQVQIAVRDALGDHAAEVGALVAREAHERGDRIVEVRLAPAIALGQLVARTLVEEVDAA